MLNCKFTKHEMAELYHADYNNKFNVDISIYNETQQSTPVQVPSKSHMKTPDQAKNKIVYFDFQV